MKMKDKTPLSPRLNLPLVALTLCAACVICAPAWADDIAQLQSACDGGDNSACFSLAIKRL
jgi:hypothetical protein